MITEKFIVVRKARFVPIILVVCCLWMGYTESTWWLLSILFVAVGWFCAVPNLNLANGMLAYLSMIGGFILMNYHRPLGLAIVTGAASGFYLSAIEMRIFGKPWRPIDNAQDKE